METRDFFNGANDPSFREQLVRKWKPLVENIKNERIAGNVAILLENQMSHMKEVLGEAAMSSVQVAEYTKFIFPMITNVWPNLISNNILAVQPMDSSIGAIAYRKGRYGTTKGGTTAGDEFPSTAKTLNTSYSKAQAAITGEAVGTGDGTSKTFFVVLANKKIVQGSVSVLVAGASKGTDNGNGSVVSSTYLDNGMVNYENGNLVVKFKTAPGAGAAVTANYSFNFENAGDGTTQTVANIYGDITIEPVRAESRKLSALMSVETVDDLKALFGRDAEADIVADMGSEMALEIDREHINTILASVPSAHQANWLAAYDTTSHMVSQVDHIRTLLRTISTISQKIYKATLRKPANWIVTSPEVIAILDQLPEFIAVNPDNQFDLSIQKVGTLNSKWIVYSDPFLEAGKILIGYKGNSFADAGFVFAPYLPMQLTPTFFDPKNFQLAKGIRTRYASKLTNAYFFGLVTVTDIAAI